ncbi:MAG: carboxypeptidase regulatory-like domain-containing protein [Planctomycetes bacterium]|nr:carboxypeptidase regulatory-like domain-containing protein [Planctomycetota bacterium]
MNPSKTRTLLPLVVLALVLLFGVIGCSKTGTVTGKVTYDGKTLTAGTITFTSDKEKGGSASAEINEEGEYKAERVPAGPCTVTVSTKAARERAKEVLKQGSSGPSVVPTGGGGQGGSPQNIQDKTKDKGTAEMPGAKEIEEKLAREKKKYEHMIDVPEKYWDAKTSELTYEAKTGKQTHDIDLAKVDEAPKTKK